VVLGGVGPRSTSTSTLHFPLALLRLLPLIGGLLALRRRELAVMRSRPPRRQPEARLAA